jgi:hypothetical protein
MIDSERISLPNKPNQKVNVKKTFGISSDIVVHGFKEKNTMGPKC